ncbi:hypothetical protein ABDK00_006785 [Niabella insulamsoli]|uniref:hypothetical protein n=1 Tax=Niabella insulamsoli TaxID=3144874 RepID=UPI0031FD3C3C
MSTLNFNAIIREAYLPQNSDNKEGYFRRWMAKAVNEYYYTEDDFKQGLANSLAELRKGLEQEFKKDRARLEYLVKKAKNGDLVLQTYTATAPDFKERQAKFNKTEYEKAKSELERMTLEDYFFRPAWGFNFTLSRYLELGDILIKLNTVKNDAAIGTKITAKGIAFALAYKERYENKPVENLIPQLAKKHQFALKYLKNTFNELSGAESTRLHMIGGGLDNKNAIKAKLKSLNEAKKILKDWDCEKALKEIDKDLITLS